jgi:hypothetical protein
MTGTSDSGSSSRRVGNVVVIGTELAAARASERQHQSERPPPSPLFGFAYDGTRGESDLLHLREVPGDVVIDDLVRRFASSTRADRELLRSSLTMDDFYTLLCYARRAAVRTLASAQQDAARRAVTALAMVDPTRIDYRDLLEPAELLSYALYRTSERGTTTFEEAATLADGLTAQLLIYRSLNPVFDLRPVGYREFVIGGSVGLIEDEGFRYEPATDLVVLTEGLADGLRVEPWTFGRPIIGTDPSRFWYWQQAAAPAKTAIGKVEACVSLRGYVNGEEQHLQAIYVFVVQAEDAAAASNISSLTSPGLGTRFAAVGVASGALCAVAVATSISSNLAAPRDTDASLLRLRPVFLDVLTAASTA